MGELGEVWGGGVSTGGRDVGGGRGREGEGGSVPPASLPLLPPSYSTPPPLPLPLPSYAPPLIIVVLNFENQNYGN